MSSICHKCGHENPEDTRFCGNCGESYPDKEMAGAAFTKTMETSTEELTTGSSFAGRYRIIEELGKGGMGRVYKALDTKINEKIAIKLIRPEIASDKKNLERFNNELKFARQISHRNVGRMYHLEEERGRHYITMEYVSGEDLKSMIRMSGQLSIGTAISIAKQICEGLEEAHRLGVIHRDLKPSNIMIDKEGFARIMDFGIARSLKAKSTTGPGLMIGTPEYMAPEQVDGKEVDRRSDLYALGIILFEMLTGRLPFEGDSPFTIGIKQKSEMPDDPGKYNARIPEDLSRMILKCLEKNPDNRYQTAGDMHAELRTMEQAVPTSERKIQVPKSSTSKEITVTFDLKKLLLPGLLIVVLTAAALIIWKAMPRKNPILSAEGKPSVAIMYFKNNTGDAGLDHWRNALADLLITDLAQSKYVKVLSEDKLYNILGELDQLEARNYPSDILREVASRGKVNHILVGGFTRAGDVFRMNITLQQAASGEVVGTESVEGQGEQSFYTMVDELTRRIKTHFTLSGEQISSDIDRRVGEITTGNPEALKFYIEGRRQHLNEDYGSSLQSMEKALALDPDFAMAFRSMAMSHNNLYHYAERAEYIRKAMSFSDRLSDRERYQIKGDFYADSERTYDKAIEAFTKLIELYPDSLNAINNLALIYAELFEWEKAIELYEEGIRRGDNSAVSYANLAISYRAVGEFDKARELLEDFIDKASDLSSIRDALSLLFIQQGNLDRALEEAEKAFVLNPADVQSYVRKGFIYRLKGEYEKAETEYLKARESNRMGAMIVGGANLNYLYAEQGRIGDAIEISSLDFEKLKSAGQPVWVARYHLGFSRAQLKRRFFKEALEEAEQAWAVADEVGEIGFMRQALHLKGLAVLGLRNVVEAERTAEKLKKLIDSGMNKKIVYLYYHLNAEIALHKGHFSEAIDFAKKTLALQEFGPLTVDALFIDTLARAYQGAGDLDDAKAEYKRIATLTTGRQQWGDVYVRSFYRLGGIYEQQGDTAKARENYSTFLSLWKNADPALAEVEDAKRRLAELSL